MCYALIVYGDFHSSFLVNKPRLFAIYPTLTLMVDSLFKLLSGRVLDWRSRVHSDVTALCL